MAFSNQYPGVAGLAVLIPDAQLPDGENIVRSTNVI